MQHDPVWCVLPVPGLLLGRQLQHAADLRRQHWLAVELHGRYKRTHAGAYACANTGANADADWLL